MKIALFGSNGQVGHELLHTLSLHGEVLAFDREAIDLADLEKLHALLHIHEPDLIVNAAAYTAVDKAETEKLLAHTINAASVQIMANYSQNSGARLIHYSTDYVFDGKKEGRYIERDPVSPLNIYGKSKLAGEEVIQNTGCQHLIFRTSWVYGVHGNNFIKTILRLAEDREELNIVVDQVGSPTSAELIADITSLAIHAWRADILQSGLYHLAACGEASWHALASYVVERALARGEKLKVREIRAIPASEYPLPALRPANSLLDSTKLADALNLRLPDWRYHVERVLDQLISHQKVKK